MHFQGRTNLSKDRINAAKGSIIPLHNGVGDSSGSLRRRKSRVD